MNGLDFTADGLQHEFLLVDLYAVEPVSGPEAGGTLVVLTGAHFFDTDLNCRFGDLDTVVATVLSTSTLRCVTPPSPTLGWVPLKLVSYSTTLSAGLTYEYYAELTVSNGGFGEDGHPGVYPVHGPTTGGTIVNVVGQNLVSSLLAMCRFGSPDYDVPARYTNAGTYECASPGHHPGIIYLEISANGQQFSTSEAQYEYYPPVTVTAIFPYRGTSEGGLTVYVTGTNFRVKAPQHVQCRFNTTTVDATVESSTLLRCHTPALGQRYVPLEVSNNFQDFSSSGIEFLYQLVRVLSTEPSHVSQLGGESVAVNGSNFMPPDEGLLWCIFGDSPPVLAVWESTTRLRCTTPPEITAGTIELAVMSNQTIYTSTTTMVVHARPDVVKLEPWQGPVRGGSLVVVSGAW